MASVTSLAATLPQGHGKCARQECTPDWRRPSPPGLGCRPAAGHSGTRPAPACTPNGDSLAHRDPNPANFVVDGERAWMVDFGWACRGPAWMTSARLVLAMMEAG